MNGNPQMHGEEIVFKRFLIPEEKEPRTQGIMTKKGDALVGGRKGVSRPSANV